MARGFFRHHQDDNANYEALQAELTTLIKSNASLTSQIGYLIKMSQQNDSIIAGLQAAVVANTGTINSLNSTVADLQRQITAGSGDAEAHADLAALQAAAVAATNDLNASQPASPVAPVTPVDAGASDQGVAGQPQ